MKAAEIELDEVKTTVRERYSDRSLLAHFHWPICYSLVWSESTYALD